MKAQDAPASLTVPGATSPPRRERLQWQIIFRFGLVFLVMALMVGLLSLQGFRELMRHSHGETADYLMDFITQRHAQLEADWQKNGEEVKAQIDFMRIFADDRQNSWLRLRAYFSALEGSVRKFESGLVLRGDGRVVFRFGRDAGEMQLATEDILEKGWFYSQERRQVSNLITVPLWLGPLGMGSMVLVQPVDVTSLKMMTPPDAVVYLVHDGRVLTSSEGSVDIDRAVDASYSGPLLIEGQSWEQRIFSRFGAAPDVPRYVLRVKFKPTLSTAQIFMLTILALAVFSIVLWLALGRWVQGLTQRVGWLSVATGLFARHHRLDPAVREALAKAQIKPDEIGQVATSTADLMRSVLLYDQEHFAYLQTLDILEEGVVELAADGRYLRASPGWARLSGQGKQAEGMIFDLIHPDDQEDFRLQFEALLSGEKASLTGRMRLRRADGKDLWIEYRFVSGEAGGRRMGSVRGVLRDVTQSYQLEKHVTHMALHDALTGLPNRVLLEDRCKVALRTAERHGHKVALGFMDLDHFKHVNDQFGHKGGDELLVTLAHSLRQCLRAGDTLARWGGDEFVVLLTDLGGMDDAREAIAKQVAACDKPIAIDGNEFNATFSMGVSMYPDDADTVETLLSQADRAMFSAKQQGRNTVRFFADIAQREEDRKALYIQSRLATAIKEQQIQTWFQPIVDARTQRIVGCEALARWHDETYGWVSPATFIPMAENLGLIREIGQQVWKQAIESLHRWRGLGVDIKLSVNVSRRQLFTPTFTADLLADLTRLEIPVSVVDLEITESVAMEEAEHTTRRLAELAEAGFGMAIDDFGTGYSSLSQLHDMPASKIKIDISFVRRAQGAQGAQLIQAIVKIATAFQLKTVAEGVESVETAAILRELGVDLLQGYHFGKPMEAQSFEGLLMASIRKS